MIPRSTILLVDDVRENLVAMGAVVRRDDVDVVTATCGREALEIVLARDVAVAVLDVQMPEMDGYELAELLRSVERTRAIPLIFVTAGPNDTRSAFRGYESGAVDFLFKPINPTILASKVNVFVQLHRQRQLLAAQIEELEGVRRTLLDADRRKNEFLATLSHELRNPLTPIRNAVHVLCSPHAGQEQVERAKRVLDRQTRHLAQLVEDLLDVTRIGQGKIQLQVQRVDLREVIRRVVEDFRSSFEDHAVALATDVPPCAVWADVDVTRITQALGNLLHNAAKFTRRGDAVTVSLATPGGAIEMGVRDTGAGIDPKLLETLFEPFVQGERTLARTQGGLGLGLALVKGIAALHGGSVHVTSGGAGAGASFTIRLPGPAALPAGDDSSERDASAARAPVT